MRARAGRTGQGVLLMGYGSPAGPEDLPGYLTEVLAGRSPSPALVQEYERRYDLIGWSPQLKILTSIRQKLEERLSRSGTPLPVLLGTKHWTPHVAETIPRAAAQGIGHLIAIPLSPYASPWILEPYRRAIERGRRESPSPVTVDLESGWHTNPHWIRFWTETIRGELPREPARTVPLLSAHSLPERHQKTGDPYPQMVLAAARAVATGGRLAAWDFTYQSAGNTTEPWLGPDITEKMIEWRDKGYAEQLVAPIGFVFEHLEVLYDLDIVVKEFAEAHGVRYHRTPLPNDDDRLVEALASIVEVARQGSGGKMA